MPTAVVIDGAFFLWRFKNSFPDHEPNNPAHIAECVRLLAHWHVVQRIGPLKVQADIRDLGLIPEETNELYRIFFYDCPPLDKKMHLPISGRAIDLAKTPKAIFRNAVHSELQSVRKVALRLGRLNKVSDWRLKEEATLRLRKNPGAFEATDDDFEPDIKQKGVDMRLGLDIASMSFKRQVDQIVLVASDADFVPAVKMARREGIDIVLDRMHDKRTATDLMEHVDGMRDCFMPKSRSAGRT